jgi:hypothetical protein
VIKDILKALGLDEFYAIDTETFWANDYTLSRMATTEYITDPRFELQLVAVMKLGWKAPKVMTRDEFRAWKRTVNWSRAAMLAHHAHFDGYILSFHEDVKPAFYFDTISMGRPLLPIHVGGSLVRMCAAFGRTAKQSGAALVETKGKRWAEFSADEKRNLKTYGGEDVVDMWFLFERLLPFYTLEELRLIDMTIKMYAQPVLGIDKDSMQIVFDAEQARKEALLKQLKVVKTQLTSKPRFAALLAAAGATPPTKVSTKKSEKASEEAGAYIEIEEFAMSKQDQEFKDLLAHPKKRVRDLVAARFAISSNALEKRCQLLLGRAHLPAQPVYLNYYGAKTGRWSGGDKANWQNLASKRKVGGAELRASIVAPPGHTLIIADLAQIEARMNAWFCGQRDTLEAFRAYDAGEGPDVYRVSAGNVVYNKPVDAVTDAERFIGKMCELMLQYQAGWARFASLLRLGAFGPPVDISDNLARDIHSAWRAGRPFIVANWKRTHNLVKSAFGGGQRIDDGVVAYEGAGKTGWMHLPGGMAIRYDELDYDDEGISYISAYRRNKVAEPTIERTRLYGGLEVENRTQALSRRVIGEHMLEIASEVKGYRLAMMTHDEVVGIVPTRSAKRALSAHKSIMSRPPLWAKGLPLAVDAHVSTRYDK